MQLLSFVTSNANKFYECERVLPIPLKQVKIELFESQANTLKEVAEVKIRDALRKEVDLPCFIEDSGFFVEALKGFPGVYSAYVQKTIGNRGILDLLKEKKNRDAYFECVIAYLESPEKPIIFFSGKIRGTVSYDIRGTNGFGYDPIFLPLEYPTTFGEMKQTKRIKSHIGL